MIQQINGGTAEIYAWVNANKLSLNIDKINFILFVPKSLSRCTHDHTVINQPWIQEFKKTLVSS